MSSVVAMGIGVFVWATGGWGGGGQAGAPRCKCRVVLISVHCPACIGLCRAVQSGPLAAESM